MLSPVDAETALAMPMTRRQSIGLWVSIALIAVDWAYSGATYLAGASEPQKAPSSVEELATGVTIAGVLVIVIVAALLQWSGDGARGIGLRRQGLAGQLLRGALLGIVLFVLATFVFTPLVRQLLPPEPESGATSIPHLFRNLDELPLWIFTGVFGGGVIEELSRVFVLTRFERIGGRAGVLVAVVIDTALFAAGHRYQGMTGVATSAVLGLACALIYLRRRSLLEVITAHAIFDVIGISVTYALVAANEAAVGPY
jgi:membrane protease YdiL (CAAX protease family)